MVSKSPERPPIRKSIENVLFSIDVWFLATFARISKTAAKEILTEEKIDHAEMTRTINEHYEKKAEKTKQE
jgi:hypothetical protein